MSLSRAYVEFGLFVLTAAGGRELESFGKLKCGAIARPRGGWQVELPKPVLRMRMMF